MSKNWREIKKELDNELDKIKLEPPKEVTKLMNGIIESGAGSYGQYFSTLVFVSGEVRALGIYSARFLINAVDIPGITLNQLKELTKMCLPVGPGFLGYCGLKKLKQLTDDVLDSLETIKTTSDLRQLMTSFYNYVNRLQLWVNFYFPWEIGVLFPQKKPRDIEALLQLAME